MSGCRNNEVTRDLSTFTTGSFHAGRPRVVRALWHVVAYTVFSKWWCPVIVRVYLLRGFGARLDVVQ